MAWTSPRLYVAGMVMTVSIMNEISDNLKYLKGVAGTVALDAGLIASGLITATDGLVTDGSISGAKQINVSGIVTAGAGFITLSHISAAGNISVGGTVDGVDIAVHLTDRQSSHGLICGGSAQMAVACCGTYTGPGSSDYPVAHSLGRMPYAVMIQCAKSNYTAAVLFGVTPTQMYCRRSGHFDVNAVKTMTGSTFSVGATNFFTPDSALDEGMAVSGQAYYWFAIG